MVVLTLSVCPPRLKGYITRWLIEISPGVYAGKLSRRTRERLWERVCKEIGTGRATIVYNSQSIQGFSFETIGSEWIPTEFEGIVLMKHPIKKKP